MTPTQTVDIPPRADGPEISAEKLLDDLAKRFSEPNAPNWEFDCREFIHRALMTVWGPMGQAGHRRRYTSHVADQLRDDLRIWERKLAKGPWHKATDEAKRVGNAMHCLLAAAFAEGISTARAADLVNRQLIRAHPEYKQPVARELQRIDDVVALLARALALRKDEKLEESWESFRDAWRKATGKKDDDRPGGSSKWSWDWPPGGGGGGDPGPEPGPGGGPRPGPDGKSQPPPPPEIAQFMDWWSNHEKKFRTLLLATLELEMAYRALYVGKIGKIAWPVSAEKAMIFLKRARSVIADAEHEYLPKSIYAEIIVLEFVLEANRKTRTDRALVMFLNMGHDETGTLYKKTFYDVTYKLDDYKAWPKWMPDKANLYKELALSHCEHALVSRKKYVEGNLCSLPQLLDDIENAGTRIEVIESILAHLVDNVEQLKGEEFGGWDAVAAVCVELLAGLAPQVLHVLMTVWNFLDELRRAEVAGCVPKLCKAVSCWPAPPLGNRDRDCLRLHEEIQKLCQTLEAKRID